MVKPGIGRCRSEAQKEISFEKRMVDAAVKSEEKPVILVADDDEMQRFLMSESLEAEGFQVELVANGIDAVEQAEALRPDVVLLDVVMPGMDGYAVCAALRALAFGEQLPIVMVTGQDDIDSIARAYDAGATDFIAKPLNWTLLRHRIRYVYRAGNDVEPVGRQRNASGRGAKNSSIWAAGNGHVGHEQHLDCSTEVSQRIFSLFIRRHADNVPFAEAP